MATVTPSYMEQIGRTAGLVWNYLNDNGSISLAKLVKQIDAPRDLVMQSVGWLAREGKVEIEESEVAPRLSRSSSSFSLGQTTYFATEFEMR